MSLTIPLASVRPLATGNTRSSTSTTAPSTGAPRASTAETVTVRAGLSTIRTRLRESLKPVGPSNRNVPCRAPSSAVARNAIVASAGWSVAMTNVPSGLLVADLGRSARMTETRAPPTGRPDVSTIKPLIRGPTGSGVSRPLSGRQATRPGFASLLRRSDASFRLEVKRARAPAIATIRAIAARSAVATLFNLPRNMTANAASDKAVTAADATAAVSRPAASPAAARTVASSHSSGVAVVANPVPNNASGGSMPCRPSRARRRSRPSASRRWIVRTGRPSWPAACSFVRPSRWQSTIGARNRSGRQSSSA